MYYCSCLSIKDGRDTFDSAKYLIYMLDMLNIKWLLYHSTRSYSGTNTKNSCSLWQTILSKLFYSMITAIESKLSLWFLLAIHTSKVTKKLLLLGCQVVVKTCILICCPRSKHKSVHNLHMNCFYTCLVVWANTVIAWWNEREWMSWRFLDSAIELLPYKKYINSKGRFHNEHTTVLPSLIADLLFSVIDPRLLSMPLDDYFCRTNTVFMSIETLLKKSLSWRPSTAVDLDPVSDIPSHLLPFTFQLTLSTEEKMPWTFCQRKNDVLLALRL